MRLSENFFDSLNQVDEKTRRVFFILAEEIEKSKDFAGMRAGIDSLKDSTKELAEAQKRTEKRLEELVEAQKKTKKELNEFKRLTNENFKKVWESIDKLNHKVKLSFKHLGSLTHIVGYSIEDKAYKNLPKLLKQDFNIDLLDNLKRDFIEYSQNQYDEINIFAPALKDGKKIYIAGECKTQLKKRDIDNFLSKIEILKKYFDQSLFPVIVTFMETNPSVRKFIKEKKIAIYYTYQFD